MYMHEYALYFYVIHILYTKGDNLSVILNQVSHSLSASDCSFTLLLKIFDLT